LFIQGHSPFPNIRNEEDHVSILDGNLCLELDLFLKGIFVSEDDTACVYYLKGPAFPVGGLVEAIPGDARGFFYDGDSFPHEQIKQG
jgi:hypothetical protein